MANTPDCLSIITGISSGTESTRKLAAYHLQTLVADASFADAFVQADGMATLKTVVLEEHGNALAYALGSFTRLLEKDVGWEAVSPDIIERAVQLVIRRPSINVLRNALFLLVLVVSRPIDELSSSRSEQDPSASGQNFGLGAVMPLLQMHESFLQCLVEKLSSADHVLCANALRLINALMRDAIIDGTGDEWPELIIKVQELGVISAVEKLMRGSALPDLVSPLLEFQGLTKVLLARWRGVSLDEGKQEHQNALKQIQLSSFRPDHPQSASSDGQQSDRLDSDRAPDKWRRLGFQSERPFREFEDSGFLGLMDLAEYVRRNLDTFQNTLLEQSVLPPDQRCPIARASLSVTMLLYEYFDIERITREEVGSKIPSDIEGENLERYIEPLLLHWERLHRASLSAFLRLWKESGATTRDYHKVEDLTRLLIGKVFGNASRKNSTGALERELQSVCLNDVRQWQLAELDDAYRYAWGADLRQLRNQVHDDSLQFLKEQRIRCLLKGAWFPVISGTSKSPTLSVSTPDESKPAITAWRFLRLSYDRAYLYYASYPQKVEQDPPTHELSQTIDLNRISSVDSSVSISPFPIEPDEKTAQKPFAGANGKHMSTSPMASSTITSITIYGTSSVTSAAAQEKVLLELHSGNACLASEWLDGLLMLLEQQPITADTNKLIDALEAWTLKVRMSNLRWEDIDWDRVETGEPKELPPRPTDRDYWYDMGG